MNLTVKPARKSVLNRELNAPVPAGENEDFDDLETWDDRNP